MKMIKAVLFSVVILVGVSAQANFDPSLDPAVLSAELIEVQVDDAENPIRASKIIMHKIAGESDATSFTLKAESGDPGYGMSTNQYLLGAANCTSFEVTVERIGGDDAVV